jgi:poly(3-hydroxybutyrate) depolymerase
MRLLAMLANRFIGQQAHLYARRQGIDASSRQPSLTATSGIPHLAFAGHKDVDNREFGSASASRAYLNTSYSIERWQNLTILSVPLFTKWRFYVL